MAGYHKIEDLPFDSVLALKKAMLIEGAPSSWYEDLAWIMAQESGGIVDLLNPKSRDHARGLFQLTDSLYSLMPNGEKSFGNAVEECRGGIRYIRRRYLTPDKARKVWLGHHPHWY